MPSIFKQPTEIPTATTVPPRKIRIAKRNRSRKGCLTCRGRHIKCDETLPICRNCIKSQRTCVQGKRLNFTKCTVVDPLKLREISTRISTNNSDLINSNPDYPPSSQEPLYPLGIDFLDHSLTVHNVYDQNSFHNYSQWFKDHTVEELEKSDADFQAGIEDSPLFDPYPIGELNHHNHPSYDYDGTNSYSSSSFNNSPGSSGNSMNNDNEIKHRGKQEIININYQQQQQQQQQKLQKNQPLAPIKVIKSPLKDDIFTNTEFKFEDFITKLLYLTQNRTRDTASLFNMNHSLSITFQLDRLNIKLNQSLLPGKIDLTLIDFNGYANFLEGLEADAAITGSTSLLETHFNINLNLINIAVKCGNMSLFTDNLVSRKGKALSVRTMNNPIFQSHENLLNWFELRALDLNYSLLKKIKLSLKYPDVDFDFMVEKLLRFSLCNDMNFFTIKILAIIIKLNLAYHQVDAGKISQIKNINSDLHFDYDELELNNVIQRLKRLQQNQILVLYLPIIDATTKKVYFPNLNIQRICLLYNFIFFFISTHFQISDHLKVILFEENDKSELVQFWNDYEIDPIKRFQKLVDESSEQFKAEENIFTFYSSYTN